MFSSVIPVVGGGHVLWHVCEVKEHSEVVLSFHLYLGSKNQAQVIRLALLGASHLCPLSHLRGPWGCSSDIAPTGD